MAGFQTVLKSARFVYSPYTATEMQGFAQVLADSIRARFQSGQNIYDQAASPRFAAGVPDNVVRTVSSYRASSVKVPTRLDGTAFSPPGREKESQSRLVVHGSPVPSWPGDLLQRSTGSATTIQL